MRIVRTALRSILFRYGWDTGCRHRALARLLREAWGHPRAPAPRCWTWAVGEPAWRRS